MFRHFGIVIPASVMNSAQTEISETCATVSAITVTVSSAVTRMKTCKSSVLPATWRVTTMIRPVITAWMPKLARLIRAPHSN